MLHLSNSNVDREYILSHVSQEEIFERYLCPVTYKGRVCSPLRKDNKPTCGFKRNSDGRIYFKDFSGFFYGDCFNVVEYLYNVDFYSALDIIAQDFGLTSKVERKPRDPIVCEEKSYTDIKVNWGSFRDEDISYWKKHGITLNTLKKFKVSLCLHVWINDSLCYSFSQKDPAYGYWFEGKFKIYFPKRTTFRFLNNFTGLQGFPQLPEKGKLLVITKSLKDVMFLHELGIPSVAPSSETVSLTDEEFEHLSSRFDRLVVMFDFDLTGVRTSNFMRKKFGLKPIFLTNGRFGTVDYLGKDVTDAYKNGLKKEVIINLVKGE